MARLIKLTDVITKFNGEEDVAAWLDRLELVAGLQKVDNLTAVIPMFLEGPAYDVYSQLSVEDKRSLTQLKKQLKEAFGVTLTQAFAAFKTRTLVSGEAPDAFLAELRRLARTVCADGDEGTVDQFVACQFVDGLPELTHSQLRALKSGGEWGADDSARSVQRVCYSSRDWTLLAVFWDKLQRVGRGGNSRIGPSGGRQANQTVRKVVHQAAEPRCYGCNRVGHVRRDCQVCCFLCNELGHMRHNCPNQIQGNDQGGGSLRANCPPVGVLRTDARLNGVQRRALIDMGCSYTLVSAAVVGGQVDTR